MIEIRKLKEPREGLTEVKSIRLDEAHEPYIKDLKIEFLKKGMELSTNEAIRRMIDYYCERNPIQNELE